MILMRDRCAKQGHDAIAGVLVDRALEAMDSLGQQREIAVQNLMPALGVELSGNRG